MTGAEGATAPETLRQKDRKRDESLESGQWVSVLTQGLTEDVTWPKSWPWNLSGSKTEGVLNQTEIFGRAPSELLESRND